MARRDWRRQLFRIRQIADQNLGRVEKSELLTADLQNLEKRVEQYGKVFAGTSKKLIPCLQTQLGQDREKRQKKLPAHALSCQLLDGATQLGVDTLIGQIFQMCGDAQAHVAKKTLDFEFEIEDEVLAPIYKLIENDIPAILKHKKNLQKVVLDMDSAKTRYSAAMKEQSKASGNNPQASTTKVDNLREEFDDACYRVDQCRDQLATEIFNLASREAELSNILLELIKCQAKYHKDVLDSLEKRIPQMEEQMQFYQHVPVFGKPIEDHLERSKRTIALVLEECVKNLITLGGLEEEGLFRIAGAANKIKKLKAAFDSEQIAEIAEEYDVHVIAGVLKLYLRELPDPLMKSSLYPEWMKAAHMPADERLQALADVLAKLPKANSENLKFLIKFLHKISEFQEVNKMSPSNLSIVMGPNLIWAQGENGPSVLTTSAQSAIVEALISHCDYFFPGDVDFRQYLKDPIHDLVPPVNLRRDKNREKCGTAAETVTKRHAISLTDPPLGMSLSTSSVPDEGSSVTDDNLDKMVIRLDADGIAAVRNRPRGNQRSGSDASMHTYGSHSKTVSVSNGDKVHISDLNPEIQLSSRCFSGPHRPLKRTVTPPPKVAPPRGMHSDVYDTVFALQSLGDGWPDYLNRVRTLWDCHMHQQGKGLDANDVGNSHSVNSSSSPNQTQSGDQIRAGKGNRSDDDIFKQIFTNLESSAIDPSQPDLLASMTSGERSGQTPPPGQPEYRQASPDIMSQSSTAQALVSSVHSSAAIAIGGSQENVSSSTSSGPLSVPDSQSGSKAPSPKPPRRINKKPAPLPPAERPHGPAPPPPSGLSSTTAATTAATSLTGTAAATDTVTAINNLPYPVKPPMPQRPPEQQPTTAKIESSPEQQQIPSRPEKQPEHQQQQQQVMKQEEKPLDQQASARLDKPLEYQATVPRPERPPDYQVISKPERPPEYQVWSKPDRPSSPTKVRPLGPPPERPQPSEKPEKPMRPEKPEKPPGTSMERLYPSLSPVVTSSPPACPKKPSLTSLEEPSLPQMTKVNPSAAPDMTEKPPVPPPPGVCKPDGSGHTHRPSTDVVMGHRRQSSGCNRPPRPQPPPPPPPNKPTSPLQIVDVSDKAISSGANTDNQTPVSPNPGEDTYL